jgi:hypothetical protein
VGFLDRVRQFWARSEAKDAQITGGLRDSRLVGLEARESMGGSPDPILEEGRAENEARSTQAEESFDAKAGRVADQPDTGETLQQDVDEGVTDIEKWDKEDKEKGLKR